MRNIVNVCTTFLALTNSAMRNHVVPRVLVQRLAFFFFDPHVFFKSTRA